MSKRPLTSVENNINSVFTFRILAYRVIDGDTVEVMIDRGFHDYKRLLLIPKGRQFN